jgi:hypothetical protein
LRTQHVRGPKDGSRIRNRSRPLLIDVVGYSKLLVNEQIELLQELNRIVRSTEFQCSIRSAAIRASKTRRLARTKIGPVLSVVAQPDVGY